jgi:hypothetical protein
VSEVVSVPPEYVPVNVLVYPDPVADVVLEVAAVVEVVDRVELAAELDEVEAALEVVEAVVGVP